MSRRNLGLGLIGGGLVIALVGLIGWLAAGGDADETPEALDTTTTTAAATTSAPSTTTTIPPTTTTLPPTTTTVPPTTTTTFDTSGAVEDFVVEFADAIGRQDIEFLMDSIHPSVLALFDAESCRTFVEEEILLLEDYRLTGEVEGPESQTIADMPVNMYRAPVAFTFQGQEFASEAGFAFEGPEVRWFTQCGQ